MQTGILLLFIIGYILIAFEHVVKVNKAAIALLTGVLCWTVYALSGAEHHLINKNFESHLSEISGIIFFLMGAMTIVELIDAHDGFEVITNLIKTTDKRKLLWIICLFTFFLSAVLDNLTATIVMVSLVRKLISEKNDRLLFIGLLIIASNAGGAWTPIGDVTTTMLWIGGQLSTKAIMSSLLIPSLVSLFIPLMIASFQLKGRVQRSEAITEVDSPSATPFQRKLILFSGISLLLFVPVFKTVTHLPPFMGMLIGLGLLWVISELIHKDKDESDKNSYSVLFALRKIDMPSILFFLGILISITALQSTGQLTALANFMNEKIGNIDLIVITIGLLSAVVDNVPLVAASIGMYDLQTFPCDHYFWKFLAYSAGTGGSILIIGSAAGVAAMGMEKINFIWYLKKISWLALIGFFAGALTFMAIN